MNLLTLPHMSRVFPRTDRFRCSPLKKKTIQIHKRWFFFYSSTEIQNISVSFPMCVAARRSLTKNRRHSAASRVYAQRFPKSRDFAWTRHAEAHNTRMSVTARNARTVNTVFCKHLAGPRDGQFQYDLGA